MRYAILLLSVLLFDTNALAKSKGFSANDILTGCRLSMTPPDRRLTPSEGIDVGTCIGIVGAILAHAGRFDRERRFCPPTGVNIGQATAVLVKYLESRPETWHTDFRALTLIVLGQTWPCNS